MWSSGMEVYPAPPSLLTFITQPLIAGVIAGVCFLFLAITLSVVTACVMNHRREQRRRKRQDGKGNTRAIHSNSDRAEVSSLTHKSWMWCGCRVFVPTKQEPQVRVY